MRLLYSSIICFSPPSCAYAFLDLSFIIFLLVSLHMTIPPLPTMPLNPSYQTLAMVPSLHSSHHLASQVSSYLLHVEISLLFLKLIHLNFLLLLISSNSPMTLSKENDRRVQRTNVKVEDGEGRFLLYEKVNKLGENRNILLFWYVKVLQSV